MRDYLLDHPEDLVDFSVESSCRRAVRRLQVLCRRDHAFPDISFVPDPVLKVHHQQHPGLFLALVAVKASVEAAVNRAGDLDVHSGVHCAFPSTVLFAWPMTSTGAAGRLGCTGHPGLTIFKGGGYSSGDGLRAAVS